LNESIRYGLEVYYWRQGNYEVDFIILKGEKIMAVEVKSGKNRMSLPGLNLFQKSYKTHKVITVGVPGFEIGEFLQTPIIEWFN
jgi:predicted AAA+ superfamily ATPase